MRKFVFLAAVALLLVFVSSQNSPAKNFYDCIYAQPNLTKFRKFFDLESNTTANAQAFNSMTGNTLIAFPDSVDYTSPEQLAANLRAFNLRYITVPGTETLQNLSNKPYFDSSLNEGLYSIGGKPQRLHLAIVQPQYALNGYAPIEESVGIPCAGGNKIFLAKSFVLVPDVASSVVANNLANYGAAAYGKKLKDLNFLSSLDGADRTILVPKDSAVPSGFTAGDAAVHVLTKAVYNLDVQVNAPVTATTLSGASVTLARNAQSGIITVTVNGVTVNTEATNILTRGGTVHVIDGVLSTGKANTASFLGVSVMALAAALLTSLFALF